MTPQEIKEGKMEYTKGELSTGYNNLIREFTETHWKPNLDKFQLATILELFLGRTSAPDLYEALKAMLEGDELDPLNPNRVWQRVCPTSEAIIKAFQVLIKAEGK